MMNNPDIIRNRRKIEASINNAKKFLEVQKEFGSFDNFIWSFVDNNVVKNHWKDLSEIPATSELSDKVSKELKGGALNLSAPPLSMPTFRLSD